MRNKEVLKFSASGIINIFAINSAGQQKLLTRSNAILPNANYLISRLLLKDASAQLTNIRVYNGATLKAVGIISIYSYVNPNEAHFEAVFDGPSFNGSFTKVELGTSDINVMGAFSQATGLTLSKLNTETILITWNIKIN